MKNALLKYGFFALALAPLGCTTSGPAASQTSADSWTPQKADKWFRSRVWANGLKLNVQESVNKVEFARQYTANKAAWDKAFAYFRDTNLEELPVGKYPIDADNVFAAVTDNPTKEYANTNWESHRKYIDMQYVVRGAEKIGQVPMDKATVIKPYDEARDVANYSAEGPQYEARPGTIYLFFPQDVHRPNIKVEGIDKDKKVVVKVRVAQ
ncbi:YhcH/YjgK/YiaL family protein [Hymenobacter sp. BT523]|uniref:YhcH/YjgK/YiaL family protein n=1 Tax=Hymenobacter sp. BT523 TaxID=2795725 RepID=UPI0018EE2700|nr:YhcH/YjgK/YiaL family protein [Hymenobacter sp. BT523]MBJ6107913.1 YhcH/YjgK/YiaL family protein [Hymenobacter sp. BT523]